MGKGLPFDEPQDVVDIIDEENEENFFANKSMIVKSLAARIEEKGIEAVTAELIPDEENDPDVPAVALECESEDIETDGDMIVKEDTVPMVHSDILVVAGKQVPKVINDDLEYIRGNIRGMIDTGSTDMQSLSKMARDMNHPRVFEVLCTMMGTMQKLNDQLLSLNTNQHKMLKESDKADGTPAPQPTVIGEGGVHVEKGVVMTTAQIQRMLKDGMTGSPA